MKSVAYPELVTGREDGLPQGRWLIEGGSTKRGHASCNLLERVMEIPLDDSPTARVVRAHELMHARISPLFMAIPERLDEIDRKALTAADEFRVNYILGRIGFNTALLRDGTEKIGMKLVGEANDWNEAVCFLPAILNTGAEKDYFSGIRAGRKEWLPALRAIRRQLLAIVDPIPTRTMSDTKIGDDGVPIGYDATVVPIARLLTDVKNARPPRSKDEFIVFERSLTLGGRRAPSGKFAPLQWSEPLAMKVVRQSRMVRKSRPSQTGVVMRYPSRWIVDEQRRAFARRVPVSGGVVVIDQSGSMDLDSGDLQSLIHSCPGALVIGYSHKPGDLGRTPNAWILAANGRVALDPPAGNIGNGVDGPVLRFALSARRAGEPVVWVCDGQVTDSNDHPDVELSKEVAELVRVHGVVMVKSFSEVRRALRRGRPRQSNYRDFGRVGAILAK